MRELTKFWTYDLDEEEEIFDRTSWMVPGFDRNCGPRVRLRLAKDRKRSVGK